ncbi:MAG: HyaD/HybD family hydrogenase maturation endopeptidase [Gammaproteobacteria bacterium]|nr:HyaD/HybD family hydrogenase maturation endopeptidase [Gammaproteobacteria bacterium]
MNKKVLVLGLGNTLQTDEGIGVHVVNYIKQTNCIKNADIVDGGTHSFNLAIPIEQADRLIVVDTAELNLPPGSIRVFEGIEMDAFIANGKKSSAHEIGLKDALGVAMLQGKLPAHRALVGIQPEKFGWGEQPTEKVAEAIPRACSKVFEITENWKE